MKHVLRDETGQTVELELEAADAVIMRTAGGTAVALFDTMTGELKVLEHLAPDSRLTPETAILLENLARAYRVFEASR